MIQVLIILGSLGVIAYCITELYCWADRALDQDAKRWVDARRRKGELK